MHCSLQGPFPGCHVPHCYNHCHHRYGLGIPILVDQVPGRPGPTNAGGPLLCASSMPGQKLHTKTCPTPRFGIPPLNLLIDHASQRYGIQILLSDPPHPLAHSPFEALHQAASAAPVPQNTGLARIDTLLHQLQFFSFLRPSHEIWLPQYSPVHWKSLRHLPNEHLIRIWKLRNPTDNPSPEPPRP